MEKTSHAKNRHHSFPQTHYLTLDTIGPVLKLPKEQILELEDKYSFLASHPHPVAERYYTNSDIKRLTILRYLIRDRGIPAEHIFYAWKAKEYEEATLREEPAPYRTQATQSTSLDFQLLITVTTAINDMLQYAHLQPDLARQQLNVILQSLQQSLACETSECVITFPGQPDDLLVAHNFQDAKSKRATVTALRTITSTAVAKQEPIITPQNRNRSICVFPLMVGTAFYGTVTWVRRLPHRFTQYDIQLCTLVAKQIASLLHTMSIARNSQEQIEQLENTLAALPEGIIIRNNAQEVTQWNEAALEMAANRSEVIAAREKGHRIIPFWQTQLPNEDELPYDEVPSIRAILSGKPVYTKHLLMKREGDKSNTPILVTAVPVKDKEQAIQGSIVIFQDISRVSQFSPDFKLTMRDKAHELTNKLCAAFIGVGLIETIIEKFDVNGTLNSSEILQQKLVKSSQSLKEYITRSQDIGKKLTQMIESGLEETNYVSFVECLREKIDEFKVRENNAQISLPHTDTRDTSLTGLWRKIDIESIISNLIMNALKYSPKSSPIEISLILDHIKGDSSESTISAAHLVIRDYGIGIAQSELPHIFDEDYRGTNAQQENTYGTGFGLAMVKTIVNKYQGEIHVESELGKGTSFHVLLPIIQGSEGNL